MMTIPGYTLTALVCKTGDLLIYRATRTLDGLSVLLKIPANPHPTYLLASRLEHEYELARDLDSSRIAKPLALERHAGRTVLVLAPGPDRILASLLGSPMAIPSFLRIAIGITDALAELHRHKIVHKDIKPEHVLLDADDHTWLTGLGIASRLPRERQAPEPPEVIVGTLAYMAPEQTGRMNRSIDSRSDLYALGVIFYQMLTGVLPFTADDPMEWVHCHIARQPVPPSQREPGLPELLSAMVMKLLAKTAEDRYQSTVGLAADLHRCLAQWESTGHIEPFPLGAQDTSEQLLIPEKLYGRQSEVDTLLAAFDRVVTGGKLEFVLVSGYSGVGKTAVVNELHKALVPPHGLFAAGKFDQYKRDIPYDTLVQALQTLIRQILGKSEAEVAAWRDSIQQAVSPNGQLIASLIPEVELIIGQQPPVPELAPLETQNRFQRVLRRFLGVFAGPEHPLVLFLDDLQWLDAATLALIEQLVTGQEVHHLLLIGAYRDNEVGPTHPLMRVLDAIRKAEVNVQEIVLAPLALEDVNRLVADSLHCEDERSQPLAELVYQKSGGNPFYVIQFFTALADEKLLSFDPGSGGWVWDLPRIAAKGYTDNIVELMARKLVRLPVGTQEALKHFACLGNTATIATLCLVRNVSEEALHRSLWEAVLPGMVIRGEEAYTFLHDRVQEAAYSLIPESERPAMHLHIGRLLASRQADELHETIFEVVNQFNRAPALITAAQEREHVAELNLLAGERAQSATAYQSALSYFSMGESLLPEERWQQRLYTLSFALALRRAECEFLTNQYATAERRLSILTEKAGNLVDRAAATCLGVDLYMTIDRPDRAVEICLEYLRHLGIEWSLHPTWKEVLQEYDQMWQRIGDRPIASLADLPLMTAPEWRGTIDVLTTVIPPAQVRDNNLLCLIVARAVNLSLEYGNSDGSCQAYVYLGMLLGQRFDNYQATYQFGKLALDLVDNHGLNRFKGRVYVSFGAFLNPWARHISTGRTLILSAFDILTQSGDFTWAGYCGNNLVTNLLASGKPLAEIQQEAEHRLQSAQKASFGLVIDMVTGQLGLIRALRGLTLTPSSFSTADFNEEQFREHLESDPRLSFGNCSYWIRKQQACFSAGEFESSIEAATKAERYLFTFPSFFEIAEYHFYCGLAHAACCSSTASENRKQHLDALAIHHKKIEAWAKSSPDNFSDRACLLAAEMARIEARELEAQNYYEAAIRAAHENGFVQNEALGYELASGFYRARGFIKFADTYLTEARACYARWGAEGKVKQLERLHPWLAESKSPDRLAIASFTEQLDVMAVAKAQRAISGEIVRERLTETLLRIVLESAGAQRGYLLVEPDTELLAELGADGAVEAHRIAAGASPTASAAILNYVRRTLETVILADAGSNAGDFASDEYLLQARPKSILCMPILRQATLIGVLYLENNLATGAFTPDRRTVLEILASQAAISLENALVYEALQESESKYRRIIDTANEGIWMLGPDTMTTSVNARMAEMLGLNAEEIIGRPVTDFLFEEDVPDHLKRMQSRHRGLSENYERRFRRHNGATLWALVSATPILDDERHIQGFFAMLTDITERMFAEKALANREREFRTLTENFPDGIVRLDTRGRHLYINPSALQTSGTSGMSLPGKTVCELPIPGNPEVMQPLQVALLKVVASGKPDIMEFTWPNGRTSEIRHIPELSESGEVISVLAIARDITEAKQAGEDLRQLTLFQQTILNSAAYGIISATPDGVVTGFNSAAERLLGYTADEVVGKQTPALWHDPQEVAQHALRLSEELGERILPGFDAFVARPKYNLPEENEWTFIRKDGTRVPVSLSVTTLRDESGCINGFVGMIYDLTERKHDQHQLQLLTYALDQVNESIFLMRENDPQFLYVSQGAANALGYSRSELTSGMGVFDIDPCWSPELWKQHWAEFSARRQIQFECTHRTRDGRVFPVEVTGNLFEFDGKRYNLAICRNITERKKAENLLSEYAAIFESTDDAIIGKTLDSIITSWNKGAERMLGYRADEIVGHSIVILIPHEREGEEQEILDKIRRGESVRHYETVRRCKDGHLIDVSVTVSPLRNQQGEIVGASKIARDITDRKRAEDKLRRYGEQLEETVMHRTEELMLARDAAEAANKAKSVFLANMSHELRTPMNAILGFSSILRKNPRLQANDRRNIDIINRSGEHLLCLINDVLEMAKIEAGRVQLDEAAFDLGEMVLDVMNMMQVRAVEKNLLLLIDQSSAFPRYIVGDQARLRQVLINLVGNALKFTQQGSVTIRLSTKNNAISHLLIEVEDSGPGISQEDKNRIFEPFVQIGHLADNKGTGLGLSIARQFVQLMKGHISMESTLGKGSLFRIDVPLKQAQEFDICNLHRVEEREVLGLVPGQADYRILIVEDQLENQLLLANLMQSVGFQVKTAENGKLGVALFQSWHPHLIWMDRQMPVMDGLEATRIIRTLPDGKEVKIVAVTASVFTEQRTDILAAGMDDFICKPYRANEIYDCLSRQLGVQYVHANPQETKLETAILTPEMLAVLPTDLRRDLELALKNLDSERIVSIIQQIAAYDQQLTATLTRLADNYDYPTILKMLRAN